MLLEQQLMMLLNVTCLHVLASCANRILSSANLALCGGDKPLLCEDDELRTRDFGRYI